MLNEKDIVRTIVDDDHTQLSNNIEEVLLRAFQIPNKTFDEIKSSLKQDEIIAFLHKTVDANSEVEITSKNKGRIVTNFL